MKRICYSVAVSLDGYIADPNGGFDWIVQDPEVDFAALFAQFDTLIMGRKTFEVAQAGGGLGQFGMRSYVYSRTLRAEDWPGVTIVPEVTRDHLSALKREAGKDIWLFGGGELFRTVLALGEVDAVETAIIPVLLGGGLPLLPPAAAARHVRLTLTGSRVYERTGIVRLSYDVSTDLG